jgi:Flp pilus assembly protein TadG
MTRDLASGNTLGMGRLFATDTEAATAVEFALVLPVLVALMFGVLALVIGFWTKSALQSSAQEAARCIAIAGAACSTVPSGCDSSVANVCYVETIARQRGISNITAAAITVDTAVTYGSASFTVVTVAYSYTMLNYSVTLTANGSFPNLT